MVQVKIYGERQKINRGKALIALVLATFGLYFLVTGFVFQFGFQSATVSESRMVMPLINYLIGLALLFAAKMFKQKAIKSE